MAKTTRTSRFSAPALKVLLETHPFPRRLWEAAVSEALHLRIGNRPPTTTRAKSLDLLDGFLDCTQGLFCGFCEEWTIKEAIYFEIEVAFDERDGTPGRIPCAVVARTTHGLIDDLRFHLDPTPLRWTQH